MSEIEITIDSGVFGIMALGDYKNFTVERPDKSKNDRVVQLRGKYHVIGYYDSDSIISIQLLQGEGSFEQGENMAFFTLEIPKAKSYVLGDPASFVPDGDWGYFANCIAIDISYEQNIDLFECGILSNVGFDGRYFGKIEQNEEGILTQFKINFREMDFQL